MAKIKEGTPGPVIALWIGLAVMWGWSMSHDWHRNWSINEKPNGQLEKCLPLQTSDISL